jgi:hypothetical protein
VSIPFTDDSIVIVDVVPDVVTDAPIGDKGWFIWAASKAARDALVGIPDSGG